MMLRRHVVGSRHFSGKGTTRPETARRTVIRPSDQNTSVLNSSFDFGNDECPNITALLGKGAKQTPTRAGAVIGAGHDGRQHRRDSGNLPQNARDSCSTGRKIPQERAHFANDAARGKARIVSASALGFELLTGRPV